MYVNNLIMGHSQYWSETNRIAVIFNIFIHVYFEVSQCLVYIIKTNFSFISDPLRKIILAF